MNMACKRKTRPNIIILCFKIMLVGWRGPLRCLTEDRRFTGSVIYCYKLCIYKGFDLSLKGTQKFLLLSHNLEKLN